MLRMSLIIFGLVFMGACGTQSKAGKYVTLSDEEKAREALDARNFSLAIELYKKVCETFPERYDLYPYLASSYAGLAGFDIIEAVKSNLSKSGPQTSLQDTLGSFLPADPTDDEINAMRQAKETILAMPEAQRDKNNTKLSYASGAALQFQLYSASYAILFMNRFTAKTSQGNIDPSRLASMTADDATAILTALGGVGGSDGTLSTAAQTVLAEIAAEPGADDKERLSSYLAKQ